MNTEDVSAEEWWRFNRLKYNKGLIIAGFIAFLLYCALGEIIIARHEEFEETIFEMIFQGGLYFIMILIANIFYSLGCVIDKLFNTKNSHPFRERLFALGYWFSVSLPIIFILYIMAIHY
ncbi:MAG TPA: hypothetical protein VHA56_16940 [Mucilaginibacter sp.]|nr:hypothetical protein [Mucilaginibacter sp.]